MSGLCIWTVCKYATGTTWVIALRCCTFDRLPCHLTPRSLLLSSFWLQGWISWLFMHPHTTSLCADVKFASALEPFSEPAGVRGGGGEKKGVQENQDQAGMSDWQWDVTKCLCVGTFCRIWVDGQAGRRLLTLSQHDSDARLPSSNRRWRRHLSCAKRKHTEMTLSMHAWHWFPEPLNTHWFCHPCKISALSCLSTLSHEAALIFGLPDVRSRC